MQANSIRFWSEQDQPVYKFCTKGAKHLSDYVNRNGSNSGATSLLRGCFAVEHRLLQQYIFQYVVMPIIFQLASAYREGRFDARNEWACKMASELVRQNVELSHLYKTGG